MLVRLKYAKLQTLLLRRFGKTVFRLVQFHVLLSVVPESAVWNGATSGQEIAF